MGKISVEERNGYISGEIKVDFISDIALNGIKLYIFKKAEEQEERSVGLDNNVNSIIDGDCGEKKSTLDGDFLIVMSDKCLLPPSPPWKKKSKTKSKIKGRRKNKI